jgi:DNA-directed RNA polymerase specialized sigma24 family protein
LIDAALKAAVDPNDHFAQQDAAQFLGEPLRRLACSALRRFGQRVTVEARDGSVQIWWTHFLTDRQQSRRPGSTATQYLHALMLRSVGEWVDRRRRPLVVPDVPDRVSSNDVGRELQTQDEIRWILSHLGSSLAQRAAAFYFDGKTVSQIAVSAGCSSNAVRMSLFHARRLLRQVLDRDERRTAPEQVCKPTET